MRLLRGFTELIAPSRCVGCDELSTEPFCIGCESLVEPSASPNAVFEYGGPVADAIHRYKYRGRSELSRTLGCMMAEAARRWLGQVDAVAPVPLHWCRRRWRGYDQAALLARPVGGALEVPTLFRALRRIRHTPSQVELPPRERRKNVEGAFVPWRLRGVERVLLVDDVRTTGATLDAATAALGAGGVREVRTLVLAARVPG
jgi:ComF family protein